MARRQDESEDEEDRSSEEGSGEEESSSESGYSSSGEEDEDVEDAESEEDEEAQKAAAKFNLVEADLVEIKKMMEEMDRIKMRLQFRLAREVADAADSPLRRRSSVEDIYVPPPTVSAAVQTAWDMPRMYEVEKMATSPDTQASKTVASERQGSPVPVNKSVQMSLHDLARSYGVQEALFDKGSTHRPHSPAKAATREPTSQRFEGSSNAPPSKLNTHVWDGLVVGGVEDDQPQGSEAGDDKPPRLNRSQLTPELSEHDGISSPRAPSFTESITSPLEDSFGIPNSPTKTSQPPAMDNTSSRRRTDSDQAKTVEQKEMEAIKSLLFF